MRKRTWVIRIGEHWFLRNIRDLYERLALKHSSKYEPRGIQSLYPDNLDSPFWFRNRIDLLENNPDAESFRQRYRSTGYVSYFKDEHSAWSFQSELPENTQLNLYLVARHHAGTGTLSSLDVSSSYRFSIDFDFISRYIDRLFKQVQVKPTKKQPLMITLVAMETASRHHLNLPFAVQLLKSLHARNNQHIMLKAPQGTVQAPWWGKKMPANNTQHFYLGNQTIYRIAKSQDWRFRALKVLARCKANTRVREKKDYLKTCIQEVSSIGYITRADKLNRLKALIQSASTDEHIQSFRYGTGFLMRFFNRRSRTEIALKQLAREIQHANAICAIEVTLG